LLRERVAEAQLGTLTIAAAATEEQLLLAHAPEYLARMLAGEMSEREMRRIGFPWSLPMVERARRSVGATIAACRTVLQQGSLGIAVSLAGGTHHAYADHGEGYCVFNDSVVAARCMQTEGLADRVVVIDLDVHQGNGTAALVANDATIFSFSVHGASNYPFQKETSDLDIALPDGTTDQAYLDALEVGLSEAIERSHADLAIYLAGADPYQDDRLGRLKLTKEGLLARDRLVLDYCQQAGLPIAITMAGGYAHIIVDAVDIHFRTIQLAQRYAQQPD
jgi:acetoin utilization deacetylase AcuC-like enzyme